MSLQDLEIKFDQAPMRTAMDVYYEQLLELIRTNDGEKLCLGSTLVTMPFHKDADEYNNFLIRLIADRVIDFGSPKRMPEDVTLGSLDSSEHFSARYRDFAQTVLDKYLAELPTDVIEKYNMHQVKYEDETVAYNSKLQEITAGWKSERESRYPGKSDAELELERATYFNNRRPDFDQLRLRLQAMKRTRALMGSLLRTGSVEAKMALSVIGALDESDQYLPNALEPTIKYQWDAVWLGNPINTLGDPSYLDKRPSYVNTFDYDKLLSKGERTLVITSQSQSRNEHSRSWSASASARYGFFFKAKVQASETTKTTEAIRNMSKIEVKFQHLYEVLVGRGSWYNKDIFIPAFQADGDAEKKLASRLRYAIKSVIVARGLTLLLHFEDERHATHFRQFSASGKGGMSFLGGLLPLGASGSYNTISKGDDSSLNVRTVSFTDDADVVRMVGYRVEQVHDYVPEEKAITLLANGKLPVAAMKDILLNQSKVKRFNFDHELL